MLSGIEIELFSKNEKQNKKLEALHVGSLSMLTHQIPFLWPLLSLPSQYVCTYVDTHTYVSRSVCMQIGRHVYKQICAQRLQEISNLLLFFNALFSLFFL